MAKEKIVIKGARQHNLKNINLEIPRDKLIVFTGISGSGKSSLAFDTIYAEGQRRYVESLSSYARMFLGQVDKPDVDSIEGLSPAISIDQKTTNKNPRSTVGTVTEIYDYLRLLYARVGVPHCPNCGKAIERQTSDQITEAILKLDEGTKIQICAPIVRAKKGEHKKEIENAKRSGFVRLFVDGNIYDLNEEIKLDKNIKHTLEIIVDRLVIKDGIKSRLSESIETATALTGGIVNIITDKGENLSFSENYACDDCGISMPELTPAMFSFNSPFGACPTCTGIGKYKKVNVDLIVKDDTLSINEGAIKASGWGKKSWFNPNTATIADMYYHGLAKYYNFSLDTPFKDLPKTAKDVLLYGTGDTKIPLVRKTARGTQVYSSTFEGVVNNLERRYKESTSELSRMELDSVMSECECPECKGLRLKPEIRSVTVGNKSIIELCDMSVDDEIDFLNGVGFTKQNAVIAAPVIKEIIARLNFLKSVGLSYLTLSRAAGTLSGGEAQRIRLATQIGSALTGVLYVLDEPSIGLHQSDNDKLIATLKSLRDIGNTVIVVEHDEDTMRSADYIVDIGPGAGVHGGNLVAAGTPKEIADNKNSVTGDYLSGRKSIAVPNVRRKGNGKYLYVKGAAEHNLKNINVKIPLGKFVCVTGVSGSGKSSLVNEILNKYLNRELNKAKTFPGKFKEITGLENLDKVIDIDQSPIGRTPRSNPATYTGVFGDIREIFAQTKDAKAHGFLPGRFSFNVKGGRCEACQGDGIIKIEMHFLPDIYVPCEVCGGKRYNSETLNIRYKGKNIYEVLEMTVEEGMYFFESLPKIYRKLKTLFDVGLGYIKIGQSATTLSGGEAQRVKLATELAKRDTGKTIYILDEPTTGLHSADVNKLIEVLNRLVDAGNTVLVIEHNLDVIKTADYIIDLGPEGGDKGGEVVATGTPEELAKCTTSKTGIYLKEKLTKS